MRSSLPSLKRILLLVLAGAGLFGLGSAATIITLGVLADRQALAKAEAHDAAALWMDTAERFERLALADPFLLPRRASGDAAEVYWPRRGASPSDCHLRHRPRAFDDPAYQRWPDALREAARCPRLDEIVQAAGMPEMDVAARLAGEVQAGDFFSSFDLFRAPEESLYSLLARARQRIEERDFHNAELDARAVISAGRQFVWNSLDINGVSMGLSLMSAGLDHIRELYERRGDPSRARLALAVRDTLDGIRQGWVRVLDAGQGTSAFPRLIRYTVAAAENDALPLGVRSSMVVFVGYGHVGNSVERLLGPDPMRARALARLERDKRLRPAVAQARKGLELSWRERQDLASQFGL